MLPPAIDLDREQSWPSAIVAEVTSLLPSILRERQATTAFELSGDRWHNPVPPTLSTKAAYGIINHQMADRRIKIFHATRLLDFDTVRHEGLRPLDLDHQINTMRAALLAAGQFASVSEIDALIATVNTNDDFFRGREGQVWATPLRRLLHDGGCDVFFDHWGGEAIQRLAAMASRELEIGIQSLGAPAVVTASIPAFRCCTFSDWRLAPTMVGLMLERAGMTEKSWEAWDVLVKQAIPAEWIESVLPNDHLSLVG
jgi:hypothetical protein